MPVPTSPRARRAGSVVTALAGLATAGLAWSLVEARAYVLRRVEVPVLPAGQRALRVLHLSDLHVSPSRGDLLAWVRSLGRLEPDLVVDTGDNLAHVDAVGPLLHALAPLLERPGVFVPGSNDYTAPVPKNPAAYLRRRPGAPARVGAPLPWAALRDAFAGAGWLDLTNARGHLAVDGRTLGFAGTDDAHLGRADLRVLAPRPDGDLAVGVTHAPYLRVLDAYATAGYPLVLAGHTHGGQLCLPGVGALVTNCDLDTRRASGLSHHPPTGGPGAAWLHVSAGLGTSPYTPVRFACRPAATLLTLVAP